MRVCIQMKRCSSDIISSSHINIWPKYYILSGFVLGTSCRILHSGVCVFICCYEFIYTYSDTCLPPYSWTIHLNILVFHCMCVFFQSMQQRCASRWWKAMGWCYCNPCKAQQNRSLATRRSRWKHIILQRWRGMLGVFIYIPHNCLWAIFASIKPWEGVRQQNVCIALLSVSVVVKKEWLCMFYFLRAGYRTLGCVNQLIFFKVFLFFLNYFPRKPGHCLCVFAFFPLVLTNLQKWCATT